MILFFLFICFFLLSLRYNFWRPIRPKQWPRILMYHNTDPNLDDDGMNIKPSTLEMHILYFKKKGYDFVKISDLHDCNCLALTFDDGFISNYHFLFPLLKKYNIPATIYLSPHLKKEGFEHLTSHHVKEMVDSQLVEFGAHTMTHINLLETEDSVCEDEILQSKEYVENITKDPCQSFAYPYGRYDIQHVEMLKKIGFTSAVTTKKQILAYDKMNPLMIPRLSMNGKSNRFELYLQLTRGRYKV